MRDAMRRDDNPILRAISNVLHRGVLRVDVRVKLDGEEVKALIYRVDDRTPCRVDVRPVLVKPTTREDT